MKNPKSRTENTIKNVTASMIAMVATTVLQFICRKIFIVSLGNSYLSFDGLFTNVLTMLSLAELGFGQAIIFCLYKPLADADEMKIKALMDYYAKIYRIVAASIFVLGLLVIPLFPYIMKDPPQVSESIYLIYVLFLVNTVVSYLWVYKQSLLIADQKNYIVYNVKLIVSVATMMGQILVLWLTKDYIIYLLLTIGTTFLTNVYVSIVANKQYPILKSKEKPILDIETKETISINVKSLMIYKIGTMLVTGVDNLMISSFIGVLSVGIYSNYSLVINKASNILRTIVTSTTGSVGNLNATESSEYNEKIGRVMLFVTFWIFGFASVGMFILVNPFIVFLAGREYLFGTWTVAFLVLDFYLLGVNSPMNVFRDAMGLYRYGKYRPMICACTNLVVSLALVKPLGVLGIVLGTFAARFGVTSWYEAVIVYRYGLDLPVAGYLKKFMQYIASLIGTCVVVYIICMPFSEYSLLNFVIKTIIVTVVSNASFFLLFHRTEEFAYLKGIFPKILNKVFRRKHM